MDCLYHMLGYYKGMKQLGFYIPSGLGGGFIEGGGGRCFGLGEMACSGRLRVSWFSGVDCCNDGFTGKTGLGGGGRLEGGRGCGLDCWCPGLA